MAGQPDRSPVSITVPMVLESQIHWDAAYTRKAPTEVSWFEPVPETSLALIEETSLGPDAAIIDVGGGAGHLARELRSRGYRDITVADISAAALDQARSNLARADAGVSFVEADVRDHDFGRQFDLWHDRALFHFMVDPIDRDAYLRTLRRSLRSAGFLILATFGPQGPEQCSGLPVCRYDATGIAPLLGGEFELLASKLHVHATPSRSEQQFHYGLFRRREGFVAA